MKIKHVNEGVFQPIKLEITIESEDELLSIYHRLNKETPTTGTSMVRYPKKGIKTNDCNLFKWFYTYFFENPKYENPKY